MRSMVEGATPKTVPSRRPLHRLPRSPSPRFAGGGTVPRSPRRAGRLPGATCASDWERQCLPLTAW